MFRYFWVFVTWFERTFVLSNSLVYYIVYGLLIMYTPIKLCLSEEKSKLPTCECAIGNFQIFEWNRKRLGFGPM